MMEPSSYAVVADSGEPRAQEVRVGRLDAMISGSPVCVVVGPFTQQSEQTLARRLHDFSNGQPTNRVGLIPSRETTRWKFVRNNSIASILDEQQSVNALGERDMGTDVDSIVNRLIKVKIDAPIVVIPHNEYLVLRFDHGIGDAHILMAIVAALSGATVLHHVTGARPTPHLKTPIWRALSTVIRTQPRDFARDSGQTALAILRFAAGGFGKKQDSDPPPPVEESIVDPSVEYQAVYVTSDVDYATRLRAQRDSTMSGVSLPALTLWSICRSLELTGIPVRPKVEVLVDLRKFLPPGHVMSGNFLAVSRLKYGAGVDLSRFGSTFTETISSTKPIIHLIGHICVDWLRSNVFRRGTSRDWSPTTGTSDGMATVTYSDITRLEEGRTVRWNDDDVDREFAVALPPASRSHIAILVCAPRAGQIAITASFFPSSFDPNAVRRALALAVTGSVDGDNTDDLLRGTS